MSADFWAAWKDFEVRHGNEDTIREMLRVKRSVQAMYNTQFTAHLIAQQTQLSGAAAVAGESTSTSTMKDMEAAMDVEKPLKRPDQVSFVRGDTLVQTHNTEKTAANPDEINLDEEEDEEEGDKGVCMRMYMVCFKNLSQFLRLCFIIVSGEEMEVEKAHIPAAIFGSLKPVDMEEEAETDD